MEGISYFVSFFAREMDNDPKAGTRIKKVMSFGIFGLSLGLFIAAFMYKKGLFVIISLAFMFVFILLNLFVFLNNLYFHKIGIKRGIKITKTLLLCTYFITLLVVGNQNLVNSDAIILLNVSSSIGLFVLTGLTIY